MPFGLCNAPKIFHRWMDSIFKNCKDFCLIYIDDIFVFSEILEEYRKHLKIIDEQFVKHGIILSPRKIEQVKKRIFVCITCGPS